MTDTWDLNLLEKPYEFRVAHVSDHLLVTTSKNPTTYVSNF